MEVDYGFWSLLPPLIAIILCFLTKQVLVSLFVGVLVGGIIISGGNPFGGVGYALDTIIGSMTDEWNASLLLFNLLMGAGVAFIWRLGGSKALTQWAKTKIRTKKSAGVGAWLLGILVFFNDYVNAAIVGNVFRDIYDDYKISTERLSYILDSTAAPVATFFISDWIAYQIGMIQSGIDAAGIEGVEAFPAYIRSIPYNMYCIFAVVLVGILAITERNFGPMLKAEYRSATEGKTVRDGGSPMLDVGYELGEPKDIKPMLMTFFLPLIVLVGVTLFGFWWTGRPGESIMEILGNSDPSKALLWGAFAMTVVGITLALTQKIMDLRETMDTFLQGLKLMLLACGILVLAWSLGTVTGDMQLADYIITLIGGNVSFAILPLIIFLFGMFISFSTGTSWGTMAILTPIAIPLAYKITGDANLAVLMAGVVFSGAIFGDHCSPISDTTVLASIFAGADHMDHVATQLPYALTAAVVAGVMYLLFGMAQINVGILIIAGLAALVALTYVLSGYYSRKYGLPQDVKPVHKGK